MSKMGTRSRTSNSNSDSLPVWVDDFKKELIDELNDIVKSNLAGIGERQSANEHVVKNHSYLIKSAHEKIDTLNERLIRLESHSMRDNLIISGLPEKFG